MPTRSVLAQHPSLVTIGTTIRTIRREQGLSQESLALLADVDRSYMSKIERGDNNVAILTLLKICTALRMTVDEFSKRAQL